MVKTNLTNFIPEPSKTSQNLIVPAQQQQAIIKQSAPNNDIWSEFNIFIKNCKENGNNFAYMVVELFVRQTLNKRDEWLQCTSALERDFKDPSDTQGGWWSHEGITDLNEFCQKILNFKKSLCNVPYKKEIKENFILTDVHSTNVRVFFSRGAEEYLKRNGVDVDKLRLELDSIKSISAAEEDITKAERFYLIQREIDRLECYNGTIAQINSAIKAKTEINEEFSRKPPVCPLEYANIPITSLVELKHSTLQKLKTLNEEYETARKKVYKEYNIP